MRKKRTFIENWASFFFLLGIIFIPFSFALVRFQLPLTDFVFGRLIGIIAASFFGIQLTDTAVYSDSVSMYILVLLLLVVSLLLAVLFQWRQSEGQRMDKFMAFTRQLMIAYLVLILLKYGLDKIFKTQFYLPEPNTLFTPMGQLSKDILFWSTMGTSHGYNIFLGIAEVVAGLFLFFRRTRLVGLLLTVGLFLHVVAINFNFDISVKVFAVFSFLMSLFLLWPYGKRLYLFFFTNKAVEPLQTAETTNWLSPAYRAVVLTLAGLFILTEAFYPYIKTGNFNDDYAQRPYLHGAYEVKAVLDGNDTLDATSLPVKRFFIHRDSYLILQDQQDGMHDYKLSYQPGHFTITDYQLRKRELEYSYNADDSVLKLRYFSGNKAYWLLGKQLDWRKMPAVQHEFNWTMDAP